MTSEEEAIIQYRNDMNKYPIEWSSAEEKIIRKYIKIALKSLQLKHQEEIKELKKENEELKSTLELYSDNKTLKKILKSLEDIKAGKILKIKDLKDKEV